MKLALIVISAVAGMLSILSGLQVDRVLKRWPRLAWIANHRFYFSATALLLAAVYGMIAAVESMREAKAIAIEAGPRASLVAGVTSDGWAREVDARVAFRRQEASEFFRSGEALLHTQDYLAAATAFRRSTDAIPTLASLANLSVSLRLAGDLPGSADAAQRAIALPRHKGLNDLLYANALLQLGTTLTEMGKQQDARVYLDDAQRRFRELHFDAGIGTMEYAWGVFDARGGNPARAERHFAAARELFERSGDDVGIGNASNALATIALDRGGIERGIELLSDAAGAFERSNYRMGLAGVQLNRGTVLQDQCQLDDALSAYDAAAEAARSISYRPIQALATANAASALMEQGKVEASLRRGEEALAICRGAVIPQAEGWAHLMIAEAKIEQRAFDVAEKELEAVNAALRGVDASGVLAAQIDEAKIRIRTGRLDDAQQQLDAARARAPMLGAIFLPSILAVQADLAEARGNRGEARALLTQARDLNRQQHLTGCDVRKIEARLAAISDTSLPTSPAR
jgi:tetratricopeptide (TPR) repeat protein